MRELSKHVFSRKGRGGEEEEKGRPCALPQQCVSRETTRRPPGQLVARVYSFGCSFVAISHSYAPSPTAPLPPTLASHACVLYTRMLFHLRKCFFSELCPDELVRRWIGFEVFQSNALANVEHRLPYPTLTPTPLSLSHTHVCTYFPYTSFRISYPFPFLGSSLFDMPSSSTINALATKFLYFPFAVLLDSHRE